MIVDIVVGAILLVSAIIAFVRGFIREVLTILGVVGGLAAAYAAGPMVSNQIGIWLGVGTTEEPQRLFGFLPYDLVANILGYGGIFIVVVIALSMLSHMLAESARNLGLGAVDRTLGMIFGLARGVLVLGVLYLPIHVLTEQETKSNWFAGSHSFVYLEKTAAFLTGFLPKGTTEKIEEEADELEKTMSTRDKLKELDLLPTSEKTNPDKTLNPLPPAPAPEESQQTPQSNPAGYNDQFRDQMNTLIKNNAGQYNE